VIGLLLLWCGLAGGDKDTCDNHVPGVRCAGEGVGGVGVTVVTKWDLLPETRSLPYSLQSAIDLVVCERAAVFVGNR
jgi:hypothetical protein